MSLYFSNDQENTKKVINCVVCKSNDFFVRHDLQQMLGFFYFIIGCSGAYWTYGLSMIPAFFMVDWYFRRFAKITVCYDCYARYYNYRVNSRHQEYSLKFAAEKEAKIRNDRRLPHFR